MKCILKIFRITGFCLCLISILLFSSCEIYHFAYPLPVDSKNIYKTPKKLRGPVANADGERVDYFLHAKTIAIDEQDTIKMINGIWINPKDTSRTPKSDTIAWKKLNDLESFKSRYTIEFDSLKMPVDTIENCIIKGNRIYNIEDKELTHGMPFSIKGDTIYIVPKWNLTDLGSSAFFRKVNRDFYLLNIRDNVFIESHYPWWQVILIEKRKDGKVVYRYWNRKLESDPTLIYSSGDDYYFDSQWTRKDILKLINEGAFESLNEKEKN